MNLDDGVRCGARNVTQRIFTNIPLSEFAQVVRVRRIFCLVVHPRPPGMPLTCRLDRNGGYSWYFIWPVQRTGSHLDFTFVGTR